MTSTYWVRDPQAPFATLAAVIVSKISPPAGEFDWNLLKSMTSRVYLASIPVFKAELRAALRDPSLLPGDELFRSEEFSEASLRQLWHGLYGDEPYAEAGQPDELDEILKRREAARSAREAVRRAGSGAAQPVGVVAAPPCAECGKVDPRIEVIPPDQLPAAFREWTTREQASFLVIRDFTQWHLIDNGPAAGNGSGDSITAERAAVITAALQPPLTYARVQTAGFYDDAGFCGRCDAPYCNRHWHVSVTGYGRCPHGHGKSLDPHWFADYE